MVTGVDISGSIDKVDNVTYKGTILEPEHLSEKVVYKLGATVIESTFDYVYEADGNTKVYFDGDKAFIISSNLDRTDLSEKINRYKKVTIPQFKSGSWTYKEIYQSLYDGKWYDKDKRNIIADGAPGYGIERDKKFDYSAINYCVESYIVTEFLNSLRINNAGGSCICGYNHGNSLAISSANNPELEDSDFSLHKRGIIKNVIESNLNQAITSYSRNSSEGDYKLPKLTETDWDQILRNVSIITFIQNIPIGMKYYNNYAIATSTMNKEYVDPEEIYLNATDDNYYHMPYCKYFEETKNMIGYRSIDYVQKSYTQGEDETKYYYKHSDKTRAINVNQACYYCLVQKSLYEENKTPDKIKAYNTALARERYVARMAKLPAEVEASYYIRVTPYTIEEGKEIEATTAQYSINDVGYTGKGGTRINKNTVKYEIKPGFGDRATLDEGSAIVTTDLGGYGAAKETTLDSQNDNYSVYQSDSNATVTINSYNETGINFSVTGNCEWTAGYSTDTTDKLTNLGPEADGYINIKLKYTRNYTDGGPDSGITATANIDSSDTLTIVTNTRDITGYVRLRFTNTDNTGNIKTYYSKNIFNVKNANSDIYCKIEWDYNWYNNNWKVEILNVAGETIKEAYTSYYTIRNVAGLKGFSNAVNGTEGPETGAKTSGRTFKVIEDISGVGDMAPIAGRKKDEGEWESYWFDGEFDGQGHTISDVKISNEDDTYTAFGLFGWVGAPGKISNLKLQIGIGVSSAIRNGNGTNWICIGGIAGYSNGIIEECEILDSSQIGSGNVIVTSEIKFDSIKLNYCVGGIVGADNGKQTKNVKVNSNVNVNGGLAKAKDESDKLNKDNDYLTFGCRTYVREYTGGIIGLKRATRDLSQGDISAVSCKVKGANNIGGVIGSNGGGNISGLEFKGTLEVTNNIEIAASGGFITFYGANAGGIVGQNLSGTISNCVNKGRINGSLNVGGIVGYSAKKDISNCKNYATIRGGDNVGGIVGESSNGTISSCINNGSISGTNDNLGTDTDTIEDDPYTGTGGIVGKLLNCSLEKSYNSGQIKGRSNVGGIAGVNSKSEINYSYNKGKIISEEMTFGNAGGICGFGSGASINGCYNIGTIRGRSCFAGIIGRVTGTNTKENISYCYNAGTFEEVNALIKEKPKGILASKGSTKGVVVNECYYRETTIEKPNEYGKAISDIELKKQLYNWADRLKVPDGESDSGKFIYNTITPVETGKGYEGYGVLWWEIEDYVKLNINMFMCVIDEEENTKTYTGIPLFSTNTYKPKVILNDKEVNFDSLPAELVMIEKKLPNDEPVECNSYLNWKFMVKNEKYTVKGSVAFTDESEYFDGNTAKGRNKFIELEKWEQDKTISVAPIMETKFDNLDSKDIEVIWKRGETESKLFTAVYDKDKKKIKTLKGYFYYKTHNSDVIEKDKKSVKIKMDKGDEAKTTKNQTVYIKRTEYYKREGNRIKGYTYRGPYYIEEGTEASKLKREINVRPEYQKAHANKSACNVYIPIENLVDIIGEDQAKNSKLYSAKLNMEFKAVLKNAILKRNTSHLSATIYLERKQKGSEKWEQVDKTVMNSFTEESEKKTIKNDETEFNADLKKLGIKDYGLAGVNYDDELRVNIDLEYNANTEYANIIIKNVNIDISYGPNYKM